MLKFNLEINVKDISYHCEPAVAGHNSHKVEYKVDLHEKQILMFRVEFSLVEFLPCYH